ncbi:hypothetical protein EYF80_060123 [Liparis tanakae]|uniref:Uncharacterized protein n=1 Tax=Liparis tanakae TaxID=230148 RepID=A0A4Z2ELV4_9TELE|nr:hypothetical protein EYF80_060123 [Liparis tanakae]
MEVSVFGESELRPAETTPATDRHTTAAGRLRAPFIWGKQLGPTHTDGEINLSGRTGLHSDPPSGPSAGAVAEM